MSIISAVREYVASCPFIQAFSGGQYVDYTDPVPGNFGILVSGEVELSRDFAGNAVNQYNFALYARGFTLEDADRVENAGFLENFSRWLWENDREGIYPDLGGGVEVESISCTNGMLFEFDESQETGLYQIQCQMIYERKAYHESETEKL